MNNNAFIEKNIDEKIPSFNIIVADQDIETFEKLSKTKTNFNFINLSSDFAVNFVLEYERIDIVVISQKISNLENIKEKALRKKAAVFIIGKDINFPLDVEELESILLKEIKKRLEKENNSRGIKKYIFGFLNSKNIKNKKSEELERKVLSKKKSDTVKDKSEKKKIKIKNLPKKDEKDSIREKTIKNDLSSKYLTLSRDNVGGVSSNIKTIKQKIIIFAKAKGGVGSTLICLFLGFMFRKMKTLILDLNFSEGAGDISYYLDMPKSPNLINFLDGYNRDSLDSSVFNLKDNLDILQSPPTYELSKKVEAQDIYSVIDVARKKYHLIFMDLPNHLNNLWFGVVDLADLLIMVSDNTLGSIGRLININKRYFYDDMEKILVINKHNGSNGFNINKNQIREHFNINDFIYLDEVEVLRGKTEFSKFNFDSLESFECITEKVLNVLICD